MMDWDLERWVRGWGRPGGRRRFKRGMLKYLVLRVIDSLGENHGYDLMRVFIERGLGPLAPGSLYPILSSLEADGLIEGRDEDGKRIYRVTEAGKKTLESMPGDFGSRTDFNEAEAENDERANFADIRGAMERLSGAVTQAAKSAKPETVRRVAERIDALRKEIYMLLANE